MNRKERRAAKKQGKAFGTYPGGPASTPTSGNLFASAMEFFRVGQLTEAERRCRDVLANDPGHADSLHLLAMIAFKIGQHETALDFMAKAIAANDRSAECQFNMAQILRSFGRLDEAIDHFRQAIALKRDYTTAFLAMADVLMQQNKLNEAQARYQQVLVMDSRSAEAHFGLANIVMQQGDLVEATKQFRRVIALRPGFAEAHNNLGIVLAAQDQLDDAAQQYQQALTLRPDLIDVYRNLGRVLHARGDTAQAIAVVVRGLAIQETDEAKIFFVQCAKTLTTTPQGLDLRGLVARALADGWGRPGELSALAAELFKLDGTGKACIDGRAADWPRSHPATALFSPDVLASLAGDGLLRALLESAPIQDIQVERLLTNARAALLDYALRLDSVSLDDHALHFFSTLAQQCFINEYVFALSEGERQQLSRLRESALPLDTSTPAIRLLAIAAYLPLHALPGADTLLKKDWPDYVARLIGQQIQEPLAERQLRDTIPALTPIEDAVSVAVREQYEDMPYPRWVKAAPVGKPATIDWYLRNQFPLAPLRNVGRGNHLDVLIAGCGTGQQAIESARRYAGAKVLAVDLSLTSLSYAKRKTQTLGLHNIDYAQADILKLGSLGRSFDVIEASGVLHHFGNPDEGWRVLLSLLRPGGLMYVGLYSAIARDDIRKARAFIAERQYPHTADGIRQFRHDMIQFEDGSTLKNVIRYSDFFSTSECRDLLFHVQEHQFTIPQIKSFLVQNNLTFVGFSHPGARDYRRRFPEDKAMTDLDRWHVFEMENPTMFVNMYQFWIQKPPA